VASSPCRSESPASWGPLNQWNDWCEIPLVLATSWRAASELGQLRVSEGRSSGQLRISSGGFSRCGDVRG
jgi:hypothetical protein